MPFDPAPKIEGGDQQSDYVEVQNETADLINEIGEAVDGAGGGGVAAHPGHRSGFYYGPTGITKSTTGLGNFSHVAVPLLVPATASYDRIAVEVTTTTANPRRFGIYADDGGYPGDLLLDAGTLALDATGVAQVTIDELLDAGWYWLTTSGGSASASVRAFTGQQGPFPVSLDSATVGYYLASGDGSALPATFPSGATLSSAACPIIALRAA